MDDLAKDVEDTVLLLETLLKLDVFVPKGVREEVLATAFCTAFKQSKDFRLVNEATWMGLELGKRK